MGWAGIRGRGEQRGRAGDQGGRGVDQGGLTASLVLLGGYDVGQGTEKRKK